MVSFVAGLVGAPYLLSAYKETTTVCQVNKDLLDVFHTKNFLKTAGFWENADTRVFNR